MRKLLLLAFSLFLTSCATQPTAVLPRPTVPEDITRLQAAMTTPVPERIVSGASVPEPAPVMAEITMVLRSFLKPNDKISGSPMSLIFLPREPVTKAEQTQYEAICAVWKASFTPTSKLEGKVEEIKDIIVVPFYWFITAKPSNESCSSLVKNYDYFRAQVFASKNNLSPTKIQILTQLPTGIVAMNLTSLKKEEEIALAMDVWRSKMTTMPIKPTHVYAIDLVTSVKQVLGALASLVTFKT